ncbi:MAG: hypothetical protein WA874_22265 [Chryseosolibacter sp.]
MKTKLLMVAMAALLLGFPSCNNDDDKDKTPACSTAWGTELQTELNAVINAATVYGNDPTVANCNSYKTSYQAYLNKLKPYGNCAALTGQNRTDFNNAVQQAEADLATLCD